MKSTKNYFSASQAKRKTEDSIDTFIHQVEEAVKIAASRGRYNTTWYLERFPDASIMNELLEILAQLGYTTKLVGRGIFLSWKDQEEKKEEKVET